MLNILHDLFPSAFTPDALTHNFSGYRIRLEQRETMLHSPGFPLAIEE
jgi:hypothetical protein